jgi:hypothetical protein
MNDPAICRFAAVTAALLSAGTLATTQTTNNSDTYEQLRLFGDVFERSAPTMWR